MQCDYTVQVARGSTVTLLLTDVNMEMSTDCRYDYVSVIRIIFAVRKLQGNFHEFVKFLS